MFWQYHHKPSNKFVDYIPAFMQGTAEFSFVALTPHPVNICAEDGTPRMIIAPSGLVQRVEQDLIETPVSAPANAPVFAQTAGSVINMPEPREGVVYIVGVFVLNHPDVIDRRDVIAVDSQRGSFRQFGEFWISRFLSSAKPDDLAKKRRDDRKDQHAKNMEALSEIVNPDPIQRNARPENNWGCGVSDSPNKPLLLWLYLEEVKKGEQRGHWLRVTDGNADSHYSAMQYLLGDYDRLKFAVDHLEDAPKDIETSVRNWLNEADSKRAVKQKLEQRHERRETPIITARNGQSITSYIFAPGAKRRLDIAHPANVSIDKNAKEIIIPDHRAFIARQRGITSRQSEWAIGVVIVPANGQSVKIRVDDRHDMVESAVVSVSTGNFKERITIENI